MQIYIFIYFIGGVERITPFCCLTVKWVTVLYGGRKMYRIITVSCVKQGSRDFTLIALTTEVVIVYKTEHALCECVMFSATSLDKTPTVCGVTIVACRCCFR